jgi:uncharacterized membrane protein
LAITEKSKRMDRFFEIILGLEKGFLGREGHFTFQFNPSWPLQQYVGGAAVWNLILGALALALVIYVYRRDGRSRGPRIALGILRALVLAFVLALLNRPVLTLGQIHREPSVLAILIDNSLSMEVKDATGPDGKPATRLEAIQNLLTGQNAELLRKLSTEHTVHIYDFARGAKQIATVNGPSDNASQPATRPSDGSVEHAIVAISDLKPDGDGTQMVYAVKSILDDLQGQRLAGVVLLTDGRETPTQSLPEAYAAVKSFGVSIYPIPVGTDKMPRNVIVENVSYEPSAFVDDITNFKVTVHATGYEANHPVTLVLEKEVTQNGQKIRIPLKDEHGQDITRTIVVPDEKPIDVELQYKPTAADMPTANLIVEAKKQEGDLEEPDNIRKVQLAVLDENIGVLYVDGYPRWDYRYFKNSMLRDKTIKISCLLTSADPSFSQEGSDDPKRPHHTWAIKAFPTSIEQLLDYDVVVFGDVDPRQFTDAQLQMVSDFVSKKGGGFEMVAGPRWSPQSFRNTPIEPLLPVIISHTAADENKHAITEGFRLALTKAGIDSSVFRFFAERTANEEFIQNHLPELFWYCRGVIAKPGVGITYAEHPNDVGPDNRKAPILVAGRFGTGRTLFSAIDDSWRWRFYTGESVVNTYWVQQLRYLARSKKLGQRNLTFNRDQDAYELGKQVTVQVRLLSPELMQQLSPPITVEIVDDATGQTVRRLDLQRQEGAPDVYTGSYTADKVGQFTARLPHITDDDMSVEYKVESPRLELVDPRIDLPALSRLATSNPVLLATAQTTLPTLIRSAAKIIPVDTSRPLWDAPLALIIFAILITAEWIGRKMFGML